MWEAEGSTGAGVQLLCQAGSPRRSTESCENTPQFAQGLPTSSLCPFTLNRTVPQWTLKLKEGNIVESSVAAFVPALSVICCRQRFRSLSLVLFWKAFLAEPSYLEVLFPPPVPGLALTVVGVGSSQSAGSPLLGVASPYPDQKKPHKPQLKKNPKKPNPKQTKQPQTNKKESHPKKSPWVGRGCADRAQMAKPFPVCTLCYPGDESLDGVWGFWSPKTFVQDPTALPPQGYCPLWLFRVILYMHLCTFLSVFSDYWRYSAPRPGCLGYPERSNSCL